MFCFFENEGDMITQTGYYLPKVEIKDYYWCYYWWINVCDQSVKNDLRTYNNIRKLATGQGDDYTTACLPNYNYFKNYHNNIAIDLRKQ